jgi:hypothetical protein
MSPRERLLSLAQRAGYSPGALQHLAQATLPHYLPGERLDNSAVATVCAAVEVCAQSGMRDEHIAMLVEDYRERFGERWRERFWTRRLRTARLRFNDPAHYGRSPCEEPDPPPVPPTVTPAVLDGSPPTLCTEQEPLPPGFITPPDPHAAATVPVLSPDIHPAVAAAPVLQRRTVA